MENWIPIGDKEPTGTGRRTVEFSSPNGCYSIIIDDDEPHHLQIAIKDWGELWPLDKKFADSDRYKFCGVADSVPEILDDVC